MTPEHVEESQSEYWLSVVACLIDDHNFDSRDALDSIRDYRDRMKEVGALEIVYHWEPSDTALSVAGRGYRTPPDMIPGRISAAST